MRRAKESGSALFVALMTMSTLALIAGTFLASIHTGLDTERRARNEDMARAIALAGIHKAGAALASDPAYSGESRTKFADGEFSVTVTRDDTGGFRATSIGVLNDNGYALCSHTAHARVQVISGLPRIDLLPEKRHADHRLPRIAP